jgi:hypothetical protein
MENCFWSYLPQHPYHFCEQQLCSWIQQPANTWSNIGYLITSIYIFRSKEKSLYRTFFFWATFILFIGSTFFHLSQTRIGKYLDVGAMLVLSMGICTLSLQRWFSWENRKAFSFYILGLAVSWLFLFVMGIGNVAFAAEIFVAVILEIRMMNTGKGFLIAKRVLAACSIEVVAFTFFLLDVTKTWCDADQHLINGHALWHLLSALAIGVLFSAHRAIS